MKLENKKILFLGTSTASVSMAKYAKKEGAYVIVTDNLKKTPLSAKVYADETADISTYDIDKLYDYALKQKVDGVFCGVSENNLLNVYKLCKLMKLPCYFTEKQWELCENKGNFKILCQKFNVPIPATYTIDMVKKNLIQYPVIVKPVDSSAGKGIAICFSEKELLNAYKLAKQESKTNNALIEQYIYGDEITVVYTIKDKNVSLSLVRDRYPSLDHQNVTSQFDASVAPSIYYDIFMKTANTQLIQLLKSIKANTASVFFQGIVANNKVYIFECGYRMNGLCDFYNIEKATGLNYMHMMVDYSVGADIDSYDLSLDRPYPESYYCIFNLSAHGGIIKNLEGLDECKKIKTVINAEFLHEKGHEIKEDNSMAQSVFRCYINASNSYQLKKTIKKVQSIVKVTDIFGNDMLFKEFDVNRLKFAPIISN